MSALLQVKIAHQITWFIGDACWLNILTFTDSR